VSLRYLAIRILGVVWVTIAATATAWLIVHLLRPNLFPEDSGPLLADLWDYLVAAFLHFDFGESQAVGGGDVADVIRTGLPADVALLAGGLLFGLAAGILGGLACARWPRSLLAQVLGVLAMLAFCAPVYVIGLGLLLLFGSKIATVHVGFEIPTYYVELREDPLGWLGAMLTPWIVLGLPLAGMCLRLMQGTMLDVAGEDYIRAARAKGLSEWSVLRHHQLPVALGPTATLAGTAMPFLLTNLVLVEQVYSVPGVFQDFTDSIGTANYALIFGMTAVGAALIATANLVFDVFLTWLDPRVRAATP
jgi:peptide/nickel transport system permease protein